MAVVNPQSRFPSSRWPLENVLSAESTLATTGTSSPGPPSPSPACRPALNVFRAAGIGDVDVISSYLSGGGNPNKTGKEGYTILHLAAMRDQERIVQLLLEHRADPDAHDHEERLTPLMWAAQLGHVGVANALLKGGADAEKEDREDLTALHWAARMGQEKVVVTLLEHHADVEAQDYDGNTPLIWASRGGHRECVHRLLDHGAETTIPDENGNTALHFACQAGHAGIASDLLDSGAPSTAPDYWQFTPFHRACSQGHGDVLMELLKSRPNGKEEVSGELGSSGSSLWNEGISISSFGSSTDSSLWNSPALLNTEQSGPAPAGGLPPNVIDLRNHFLATPLHRAAAKGHAEVVSILLQNGADVNARDGFFYTPLHLACTNGALACVEVLLKAGADPSTKAQGGITPLQASRKPGAKELIQNALEKWASRNASRTGSIAKSAKSGSLDSRMSLDSSFATIESLAERNTGDVWMPDVALVAGTLGCNFTGSTDRSEQPSLAASGQGAMAVRVVTPGLEASAGVSQSVAVMDVDDPGWTAPIVIPLSGAAGESIRGSASQHPGERTDKNSVRELAAPRPRRCSTGTALSKIFATSSTQKVAASRPETKLSAGGPGAGRPKTQPSKLPVVEGGAPFWTVVGKAKVLDDSASVLPGMPTTRSSATGTSTVSGMSLQVIPPAIPLHMAPRKALSPQPKVEDRLSSPSSDCMISLPAPGTPASTTPPTTPPAPGTARGVPTREGLEMVHIAHEFGSRGRSLLSTTIEDYSLERSTAVKRRAKSLPPSLEADERARRRRGGQPPRPPRLESRPSMGGPAAVIETLKLDEVPLGDEGAFGPAGGQSWGDVWGQDSSPLDVLHAPESLHMKRTSSQVG